MLLIKSIWIYTHINVPLYVGPCHHDTERPRVADGGDGLQIWRAARVYWISSRRQPIKG